MVYMAWMTFIHFLATALLQSMTNHKKDSFFYNFQIKFIQDSYFHMFLYWNCNFDNSLSTLDTTFSVTLKNSPSFSQPKFLQLVSKGIAMIYNIFIAKVIVSCT